MKRFFSVFLVFIMAFVMLPFINVFVAEDRDSDLVVCVVLSPYKNDKGREGRSITRITPHCMAGWMSAKSCGDWFTNPAAKASSNYGIGTDGEIGQYVMECDRAWTSASWENDSRAITIECSCSRDGKEVTEKTWDSLIKLCTDICRRYGKKKLLWIPDKDRALAYEPKSDEMLLTIHRWFSATVCPGEFLLSRMGTLADMVTENLELPIPWVDVPFAVSSNIDQDLYSWPRNNTEITGKRVAQRSIINILEVKPGPGSTYGWGRTNDGWINLDYTSYDPLTVTIDTDVRADKFIYTGAGTNTSSTGIRIGRGTFRIAEVKQSPGAICGWGKLGDGRGWINLDFTSYDPYNAASSFISWVNVPFTVSSNVDQDLYNWPGNYTGITGKRIVQRSIINILEVKPGPGSTYGWGRTNDGWINLDYTSYDPLTVTIDTDVRADKFIYTGAGTNTSSTGIRIGRGIFRIAEVRQGPGSICGWGKLGDGRGWINLDFTSYTA